MPDRAARQPKKAKSFAELLHELPTETDTLTLVGFVARSAKEGHFRLTPQAGGPPLELPVEAVRHHSVLHHEHGRLLVQLEAERARVEPLLEEYNLLGGTRTYLTGTTWVTDHHPIFKVHADPQELYASRGAAGGLAPFVLATPHHAPAPTLAMQAGGPQQFQQPFFPPKPPVDDLTFPTGYPWQVDHRFYKAHTDPQ